MLYEANTNRKLNLSYFHRFGFIAYHYAENIPKNKFSN